MRRASFTLSDVKGDIYGSVKKCPCKYVLWLQTSYLSVKVTVIGITRAKASNMLNSRYAKTSINILPILEATG
jgi:hypothetical protein